MNSVPTSALSMCSTATNSAENLPSINSPLSPESVKLLVESAHSRGLQIDSPVDEQGNTLLHRAIEFGLHSEVNQLLALGANYMVCNALNVSSKELAIEMGDQITIQMLSRRDNYRRNVHRRSVERLYGARSISNCSQGSDITGHTGLNPYIEVDAKVLDWRYDVSDVYEDYLDWNDTTRAKRLQSALDKLRYSATVI